MAGRVQNLRPWPKSMGGNPGGWPKKKQVTESVTLEEIFFGIYGKKVRELETEVTTKN